MGERLETRATCRICGRDRQPPDPTGYRVSGAVRPRRCMAATPTTTFLTNRRHWDRSTRGVVSSASTCAVAALLHRAECDCLSAFCDVVLAQDSDPRIPVVSFVDAKLHAGGSMATSTSHARRSRHLASGGPRTRRGRAKGAAPNASRRRGPVRVRWSPTSPRRAHGRGLGPTAAETAWTVVMRSALAAFYSHPVGMERDRLRRPGVPARLHPPGNRPEPTPARAREAFGARSGPRRQAAGHAMRTDKRLAKGAQARARTTRASCSTSTPGAYPGARR